MSAKNEKISKMSFLLDIKFPKVAIKNSVASLNVNKKQWGFLELFESTMGRDLRTGNPWLDPHALNGIKIKIKSRKKQVRFKLEPTIYIIPSLTEEEKHQDQEWQWAMLLERMKIGP